MSESMLIILAMGTIIFAVRSVAFVFAERIRLPQIAQEALDLVPPAILAAILGNGLLIDKTTASVNLTPTNAYLIGGIATLMIAMKVRNFFLVVVLGSTVFTCFKLLV